MIDDVTDPSQPPDPPAPDAAQEAQSHGRARGAEPVAPDIDPATQPVDEDEEGRL